MFNFFANIGYRSKLSWAFLLLSIIPIAGIGIFFQHSFSQNIEEHVFDKLVSIRDSKKSEISQYLNSVNARAKLYSTGNHVRYSISPFSGFSYGFEWIDKDPQQGAKKLLEAQRSGKGFYSLSSKFHAQNDGYAGVHNRFDPDYQDFVKSSIFSNILLLTPGGQVVYSTAKLGYFSHNIQNKALLDSPVAKIYQRLQQRVQAGDRLNTMVEFIDFSWDKQTPQVVAYLAYPVIQHNRFSGTILFALPTDLLSIITSRRNGLGKTGEAYVFGADSLPRSQLAAFAGNPEKFRLADLYRRAEQLTLPAVSLALKGIPSQIKTINYLNTATLTAFDNIHFLGVNWALIVEISAAEALQKSVYFTNLVIALAVLMIFFIAVIVYYLADSITRPLNALMLATEMVSKGDLNHPIRGSSRSDELGSLARSFLTMQQSIRYQLDEIKDVNNELEEKVDTIEQQNLELQAADKLKDEFLANTSHELRTPLHGIIGMVESLLDGAAGEFNKIQQNQLGMVKNSAHRLAMLVDDLLDFHKMRHHQLRIDIQAIEVKMLVNHVIELSKHLIAGKPLTINMQIPSDLPRVLADPTRFEQVLYNLLGNAIKYSQAGTIVISASLQGKYLLFKVTDTGIGIKQSEQAHIFKPFEQADGGITRKIGGSGLGLAISKQLVELMQGKMHLISELGKGSTFSFQLPLSDDDSPPCTDHQAAEFSVIQLLQSPLIQQSYSADSSASYSSELFEASGETVLVVDDEQINLQILQNHLSLVGYRVLVASDAQQAYAQLAAHKPALIILDVMLPEISGFDIARKIREEYDLYELPILMLTARAQIGDLVEGFNSGANDYVIKPFLKDELLSRVRTLLEASQAQARVKENQQLKAEVARRLETEQELRNSQQRMLKMLDNIEDAIITFNNFDQISFINKAAIIQLGFTGEEMIGKSIELIIDNTQIVKIRQRMLHRDRDAMQLQIAAGDATSLQINAYITRVAGFSSDDLAIILHQVSATPAQVNLGAIESALSISQSTRPLTAASEQQGQEQRIAYRQLVVNTMHDSLELWKLASRMGKIALAEQSNIWRVYMDRSSQQTRTLDKYFLEQTLPNNPRWRDVLRTGNYVLKYIEALENTELKTQLKADERHLRLAQKLPLLKHHLGK